MRFRSILPWVWLGVLLSMVCVSGRAIAAPPKIYVVTDLEGASGVYKFSQTREKDTPLGQKAMAYLMDDVAAVVRGLRDAGAGEVLVLDGHGTQAFVPHLMAPGAKYITSEPGAKHASDPPRRPLIWGLDESCAGIVVVGQHAMMGTPDGVLHHTQSSRGENRYWYNGVESGELAQVAAYAGHYGVPPILVTGDEAACREARKFFGDGCVTVAVKQGLGREAAVLYPFAETRQALYDGAKRAVAAIPRCKPYVLKTPIQAKKQWLVFEGPEKKPRLKVKEGTIADALQIFGF
jgi:D-amino peptidase